MLKVKEGKSRLRGFSFSQIKEKGKKKMHVFRINYVSQLLMSHAWESEQEQKQNQSNGIGKLSYFGRYY